MDDQQMLNDDIFRAQLHIGRKSKKMPSASGVNQKCLSVLQQIRSYVECCSSNIFSGILTDKDKISKELKDCFQQLTADGGTDKKQKEKNKKTLPEDRLLILGELGLLAALNDDLEIANNCADFARKAKNIKSRIFSEYTKAEIIVRSLGDKKNKQTQAVIKERVKSLRLFEKALISAKSIEEDKNLVELGCTLIWNNCLPMLQVRFLLEN